MILKQRHGLTPKAEEELIEAAKSPDGYFFAVPMIGNRFERLGYATNESALYNGVKYHNRKRYRITDAGRNVVQLLLIMGDANTNEQE